MGKLTRSTALILGGMAPLFVLPSRVLAQAARPSATASFPPEPAPVPAPAPVATPAPTPVAPSTPPTAAAAATPAPSSAEPLPPALPPEPARRSKMPDISLRFDPFNLLLEGRLGIELESELYKLVSVEIVPIFVIMHSPPMLNYSTYEKSSLRQESNGWGPLSGAAIDFGFWFGGKPFQGTVLRAGFTNYAYKYTTTAPANDSVSHTSRQFTVMLGSHNRWGVVTLAYGLGLAYELNQENRCFDDLGNPTPICSKDQLLIKLNPSGTSVADLHPYLYPFDLLARLSLGVVF
ncbi:MAG TPA: hypothetical protein VER04_27805 [Polyangiaceae bacterium]|nr:hypothetical protein [Polyangiaceae bacterium]